MDRRFLEEAMFRKILLPIDVAEPEIAKEAIERRRRSPKRSNRSSG